MPCAPCKVDCTFPLCENKGCKCNIVFRQQWTHHHECRRRNCHEKWIKVILLYKGDKCFSVLNLKFLPSCNYWEIKLGQVILWNHIKYLCHIIGNTTPSDISRGHPMQSKGAVYTACCNCDIVTLNDHILLFSSFKHFPSAKNIWIQTCHIILWILKLWMKAGEKQKQSPQNHSSKIQDDTKLLQLGDICEQQVQ